MSLAVRRSKMISFRLSPEEFQTLQLACTEQGIRSISDMARMAMLHVASPPPPGDRLSAEVHDLRDKVRGLSFEMDRLSKVIESWHMTGEGVKQ